MRIGFAGAGSIAGAMARGWSGADGGPEAMLFVDAGSGRASALAREVGGRRVDTLSELAAGVDLVILAVKRVALEEVAAALDGSAPPLVSVLAGVPLARVREAFPGVPVLRAMPNLAVEVRRGIVCYVRPAEESEDAPWGRVLEMLALLGATVPVEEREIDAAMAVMSSSPAYVAHLCEALARAGEHQGLDPGVAHELVVDALAGTAELLRVRDPAAIRRAVASPGGATEAGLEILVRSGLEATVGEAVEASLERIRP